MKIYHYHLLCYSIQMRILFFYIHKDSIGALSGHLQLLDIFSEIWKLIIIIIYFAIQTFIPTLLFILITFRSIYTSVFFSWLLYSCLDSFFGGGGLLSLSKALLLETIMFIILVTFTMFRLLKVTHGRRYGAFGDDRTHYSVLFSLLTITPRWSVLWRNLMMDYHYNMLCYYNQHVHLDCYTHNVWAVCIIQSFSFAVFVLCNLLGILN